MATPASTARRLLVALAALAAAWALPGAMQSSPNAVPADAQPTGLPLWTYDTDG
jgi:hypothetical protein